MSLPYIPSDTIDEARDLRRQGHSIATLASQLAVSAEDLATLLGEPAWKELPPQQAADEFCLFDGAERLQAQL